jgi:hypothetical protein
MKQTQKSIAMQLINDPRPVDDWAKSIDPLRALLYEHEPDMSRRLEVLLRRIESFAGDLDCVGADDPTAPPLGASAQELLSYLFRVSPEKKREFQKIITRADQLLGRARLLEVTIATSHTS